jgi:hypothetical protein
VGLELFRIPEIPASMEQTERALGTLVDIGY